MRWFDNNEFNNSQNQLQNMWGTGGRDPLALMGSHK